MPLLSAPSSLPARCRRPRPLWLKSSPPRLCSPQQCPPTLCPTARLPACLWAPVPTASSSRPRSPWCPSPPFLTVGLWAPLTRQPSRDPGLLRATPGPHTGARHPGLVIPWPPLVPLALGTPWRGAGHPVLVILNSPPTSPQEENLPTQHSPNSRASQASLSPQAPRSPPTPLGLPLPMGFHHLRVPPGLGIRHRSGPRPFPASTCTTTLAPLLLRFEVKLEVELALPVDLGGPSREPAGPRQALGSVTSLEAPAAVSLRPSPPREAVPPQWLAFTCLVLPGWRQAPVCGCLSASHAFVNTLCPHSQTPEPWQLPP